MTSRTPRGDDMPARLAGLLAERTRLAVVAAVVLGAGTAAEVEAATGAAGRDVRRALDRLAAGGLLAVDERGRLSVRAELFGEAAREAAARRPRPLPPEALGATAEQAEVLRHFVEGGRLRALPAARARRLLVLDFLAGRFEPGRVYPERDVNAILGSWHADHASLRRQLVDEGFLERREGFYWRSGGTVDVG